LLDSYLSALESINLIRPMSQPHQAVSMPTQLPTDNEIVAFCKEQRALGEQGNTYAYPSRNAAIAFIKCGSRKSGMVAEMLNQNFAFDALEDMPEQKRAGIHVPKIYRVIEVAATVYIVMEYVNGKALKELLEEGASDDQLQQYYNQIAKAIKLFISIKVPDGVTPGPVGGGIIKHPLFKDTIASIEYTSVDDLQQHVNKVGLQQYHTYIILTADLLGC
jgi:serine/threonine protein kinase